MASLFFHSPLLPPSILFSLRSITPLPPLSSFFALPSLHSLLTPSSPSSIFPFLLPPFSSPSILSPSSILPSLNSSSQSDPEKWSVEEVCQWLELVGLGMYRQAFRGIHTPHNLSPQLFCVTCSRDGSQLGVVNHFRRATAQLRGSSTPNLSPFTFHLSRFFLYLKLVARQSTVALLCLQLAHSCTARKPHLLPSRSSILNHAL